MSWSSTCTLMLMAAPLLFMALAFHFEWYVPNVMRSDGVAIETEYQRLTAQIDQLQTQVATMEGLLNNITAAIQPSKSAGHTAVLRRQTAALSNPNNPNNPNNPDKDDGTGPVHTLLQLSAEDAALMDASDASAYAQVQMTVLSAARSAASSSLLPDLLTSSLHVGDNAFCAIQSDAVSVPQFLSQRVHLMLTTTTDTAPQAAAASIRSALNAVQAAGLRDLFSGCVVYTRGREGSADSQAAMQLGCDIRGHQDAEFRRGEGEFSPPIFKSLHPNIPITRHQFYELVDLVPTDIAVWVDAGWLVDASLAPEVLHARMFSALYYSSVHGVPLVHVSRPPDSVTLPNGWQCAMGSQSSDCAHTCLSRDDVTVRCSDSRHVAIGLGGPVVVNVAYAQRLQFDMPFPDDEKPLVLSSTNTQRFIDAFARGPFDDQYNSGFEAVVESLGWSGWRVPVCFVQGGVFVKA